MHTKTTMTYGQLPSLEQFEQAFDAGEAEGPFRFRNDKRVGNADFNCSELYKEVQAATKEHHEASDRKTRDDAGEWASAVLYHLGFEWV